MNFGDRLLELCRINDKTRKQVAEFAGCSAQAITDVINKGSIPSAMIVYKIAQFFGVTVEYLITGNEPLGLSNEEIKILKIWGNIPEDKKESALMMLEALAEKNSNVNVSGA